MNTKFICIFLIFLALSFSLSGFADTNSDYTSLTSGISTITINRKYTDICLRPFSVKKLKQQEQSLNADNISVISKYTNGAVRGEKTFLFMNAYLRNNLNDYIKQNDITNPLKHRLKFYADSMSAVLSKTRLPLNTVLYSSLNDKDLKALFTNKDVIQLLNKPISNESMVALKAKLYNVKFIDKGFILATYDKKCTANSRYVFKICAPKNLQAVLIENIRNNNKKEVLINKGYCWKISEISIENDREQPYYLITLKLAL